MKRLIFIIVLMIMITGMPYVRRENFRMKQEVVEVEGSRDRQLRGKARVRARREARRGNAMAS